MEIRKGDIAFAMSHQHWVSRVIGKFMQSRWSHTILIREITPVSIYTVETTDFEVAINDLVPRLANPDVECEVWSPIGVDDIARDKIVAQAMVHQGEMYGYLQLLSLGIRRLLMRVGIKIPNFIRQGLVCDQLVLYAYQGSGVAPITDMDPESIDTEELYVIVSTSGSFVRVK